MLTGDQDSAGGSWPALSPGKFSPVVRPMPKACSAACRRCAPSFWATSVVPMLLDWASTPATVSRSVGWDSASWMTRSATGSCGGTVIGVSGVTRPASIAAAMVITLLTLPGS